MPKILRHHEDFLRVGIFYFASRSVSADVDISSVCLERIEDQTWFARDWFGCWKLRCRRCLRCHRFRCCPGRLCGRLAGCNSRSRRRRRQWSARIRNVGIRSRRRLRRVKHVSNRRRKHAAAGETECDRYEQRHRRRLPIHRVLISRLFFNATNR